MDLKCLNCGQLAEYSKDYDSYYCLYCNHWLDKLCTDSECEYCTKRPETPNLLIEFDK